MLLQAETEVIAYPATERFCGAKTERPAGQLRRDQLPVPEMDAISINELPLHRKLEGAVDKNETSGCGCGGPIGALKRHPQCRRGPDPRLASSTRTDWSQGKVGTGYDLGLSRCTCCDEQQ